MCASVVACAAVAVPAGAAASEDSVVSITQTDDAAQGPICLPSLLALRYQVFDGDDTFRLRIISSAPLCTALTAVAAVYRMPGNGVAWPQQLVERREFVIRAAGVTDVEFERTCLPAQFDVLTGATPQTIAPMGPWHGPLLFPFDVRTAEQDWGRVCETSPTSTVPPGPTVTSAPPTVPTTSTPGATTVPPGTATTVPDTSSTVPTTSGTGGGPTSTTTPVEVLGATTVPSEPTLPIAVEPAASTRASSSPPRVAGLALTGASITVLVTAGLALLAAGGAMVLLPRLRRPRWER